MVVLQLHFISNFVSDLLCSLRFLLHVRYDPLVVVARPVTCPLECSHVECPSPGPLPLIFDCLYPNAFFVFLLPFQFNSNNVIEYTSSRYVVQSGTVSMRSRVGKEFVGPVEILYGQRRGEFDGLTAMVGGA